MTDGCRTDVRSRCSSFHSEVEEVGSYVPRCKGWTRKLPMAVRGMKLMDKFLG